MYSRNEKQQDFAEQVESVAFCLCGEQDIKLEQFYQIFHAKGVSCTNNLNDVCDLFWRKLIHTNATISNSHYYTAHTYTIEALTTNTDVKQWKLK